MSSKQTEPTSSALYSSRQSPSNDRGQVRHSKLVRRLKIILPSLAALLIALVIAWSSIDSQHIMKVEDVLPAATIMHNELLNPRFESVDNKNQPYTITAAYARQSKENDSIVLLETPYADIALSNDTWIAAKSANGTFHRDHNILKLNKDVEIFYDQGYQIFMETITLNVQEKTGSSHKPLSGFGPKGKMSAQGVEFDLARNYLKLNGPASITLTLQETTVKE